MCFPVNFVKFLRATFLQNISGGLLLYKVGYHFLLYHLPLCVWCVYFVHLQDFISILCVSQEVLSLIESNQQICNF